MAHEAEVLDSRSTTILHGDDLPFPLIDGVYGIFALKTVPSVLGIVSKTGLNHSASVCEIWP